MRSVFCAMVIVAVPAFADDKPAVRALDLKGVKLVQPNDFGGPPKPGEIASAAELAKSKAFANDASRAAVSKLVNFDKEKLVVFAWSGSGRDRLAPKAQLDGKKLTVSFKYTVGETDDVRQHQLAFAVPKDAKVVVGK